MKVDLYHKDGQGYIEFTDLEGIDNSYEADQLKIEKEIERNLSRNNHIIQNIVISFRDGVYLVLVELVVRENFPDREYDQLYESLAEITDHPLELYVRFRTDVVLTREGPITFGMLKQRMQPYVDEQLKKQMENIVQESL